MRKRWDESRHLFDAWFWVLLTIPAFIWWKDSIFYVILVSHYANYKTAISAHEGRKAHRAIQEREAETVHVQEAPRDSEEVG